MIVGYGRNRKETDFTKHGAERFGVFIDTDASERAKRTECLQYVGDYLDGSSDRTATLLIYKWSEFGIGADLARQRAKLDDMGVIVDVLADRGKHEKPGRPRGTADFQPTPEHDKALRAAYHDEGRTPAGILTDAEGFGYEVTWAQLKYRYGNRFKEGQS